MQSLSVELKGQHYSGEYEIHGNLITVFHGSAKKSTQLGGHSGRPERLARILLLELVNAGSNEWIVARD